MVLRGKVRMLKVAASALQSGSTEKNNGNQEGHRGTQAARCCVWKMKRQERTKEKREKALTRGLTYGYWHP